MVHQHLIRKIQDHSIDVKAKANKYQQKFKSNLNETARGKWVHKSEEQKNTTKNFKMFYKAKEKVITLFDDYTTVVSKTKYESKHGKECLSDLAMRLRILSPKQMLQSLPIPLPHAKAGNTSENLVNEIRQMIYSLYQSKQITKKVYNNILNSIKL